MLVSFALALVATAPPVSADPQAPQQIRVFLDCRRCYSDYVRAEVTFVDYVRDRTEADVHVIVTSTGTGSGGREYTAEFVGIGTFAGIDQTLRAATRNADPDDVVRRQVTNMLRIGLLNYVARRGLPQNLAVDVKAGEAPSGTLVSHDRWNSWVFSLRGAGSFQAEESNREIQLRGSLSADHITPEWKVTFGAEIDHEVEEFDLDEAIPVRVERREREFAWLAVKALGEHWSIGAAGELESSTFRNTRFSVSASPAIEFNIFPYSAYNRRQLRLQYAAGLSHVNYYEETLFGETRETLPAHQFSTTFDQREPWGTVEARIEAFQYLHDLEKSRLEADAEISWRLARGFSVSAEASASRIEDQLSLPRRGATPEEILLRLRQLQSGFAYRLSIGLTYTFGSIFSSIVNPRFGQ